MPRHLWFLPALASLGVFLASGAAEAQTLTVGQTISRPVRDDVGNPNNLTWDQISRVDCLGNDSLHVVVTAMADPGNTNIEVWIGGSCAEESRRTSDAATCRQVYKGDNSVTSFDIYVRDIITASLADRDSNGHGETGVDICNRTDPGIFNESLEFFLVNTSNKVVNQSPTSKSVSFALVGPEGPTGVDVGIGEESLVVSFDEASDSENITEYRFYCEPTSGGTGGTAGTGGTGGTSGSAGTGGTTAVDGAGGADDGESSGSFDNPNGCTFSQLQPGSPPPESLRCGKTGKNSTEGQTNEGLENGTRYTVGVATVDTLGNVGTISSIDCGTPEAIDGFFERYRAAGGQGGGGFCSIGHAQNSPIAWLGAFGLALVFGMRRSRKGSSPS